MKNKNENIEDEQNLDYIKLKEKLLNLNLCINNEFLTLYIKLIINNYNTKYKKYNTAKHHIIPRYYFKYNNLKIDNNKSNIVNLTHSDHVLAHYYLAKCSYNEKYYNANVLALNRLVSPGNKFYKKIIDIIPEINLEEYQKMQEDANKIRSLNTKQQHKITNFAANRTSIHKDDITKNVLKEELDKYLNNGWELGPSYPNPMLGKHHSEETKQKISQVKKGKTPNWSEEGKIKIAETSSKVHKGKIISQETKNKISKTLKKYHWWNDGNKQIYSKECPGKNFVKGQLKNKKIQNRKWYNNGESERWLSMDETIPEGYKPGRLKKKK